jgi:hypothetical protein
MKKRVLALSILLLGLLGGFQNCAPMTSFAPGTEATAKANAQYKEIAEIFMEEAKQECAWMDSIAPSLSSLPEGSSITGGVHLQSFTGTIAQVENAVGNIHLKGRGTGGMVGSVKNFEGNLILCNMNIASIESSSGNIFIVRGNIGSISGFTGNVIIVDGEINNLIGGSGIFAAKDLTGKLNLEIKSPAP